jgi:cytoskeletal protein RodZ
VARQQARRQQRERLAGLLVVGLGIAVLLVAVLALREPSGHVSTVAHKSASSVAKQSGASPSSKSSTARRSATGARSSTSNSSSTSSSSSTSGSSSTRTGAAAKAVPLIVLNNTTIHGLAAEAAQRFETGGWTVTSSGNLTNEILSTCAYYDDSDPEAKSAAEALMAQYPTIKRVQPKFPELPPGPVVVVLTPDYSAG